MLLKAIDIKSLLTKPGKHADGAGLYLHVRKSGSASWVAQYRFGGKTHWATIGPAALVSLAQARQKHLELRLSVFNGVDPRGTVAGLASPMGATFGEWLAKYLDKKETNWAPSNRARERRDHERTFGQIPEFTALPIKRIDPAAKSDALDKLGSSARRKATSWIEAIIEFSESGVAIQRNGMEEVEHHASMPYAQVPAFYANLAKLKTDDAHALQWLILTGARSDEVVGAKHKVPATWGEIVLVDGLPVWAIDGSRMKARKVHRVPLTPQMVALLGPRRADGASLFKAANGRGMLSTLKANGGNGFSVQGFRSSFETWGAEMTDYPASLVKLCTAHDKRSKVDKAYQRSDLLKKRRDVMQDYSDFVTA
jgi:integrase